MPIIIDVKLKQLNILPVDLVLMLETKLLAKEVETFIKHCKRWNGWFNDLMGASG